MSIGAKKSIFSIALILLPKLGLAQNIEKIKYGDFNNWVTRHIHESAIIGGNEKNVYEIGPTHIIEGNKAYRNLGGSPWATSNVYAKVSGIVKASNAVYPHERSVGNKCAKLCTQIETVKVLGLINMDVMVAGSIFLGEMIEPVTSTKNPYSKMEVGVPFTKRPKSLVFDYKIDMPDVDYRIKSSGFGPKKKISGRDEAVVFVYLQKRWEDEDGNLHAHRIGSAGRHFSSSTQWINNFRLPIIYGDLSRKGRILDYLNLRTEEDCYYARNSKGKLVPVVEEGWDGGDTMPTHIVVMFSAGNGDPFVGTEGLTFYIDNVAFEY